MNSVTPIIVALDFADQNDALNLAHQLNPKLCRVKVGKELFVSAGPSIIKQLHQLGFEVFLDLKFHDIPITTAKAVKAAAGLGVWMVNVHLTGGLNMLNACQEALSNLQTKPLLIGVTVLTSMKNEDLPTIGINSSALEQVLNLANLAKQANLDGLVCSAHEAKSLKQQFADLKLVTPGIRLSDSPQDDQNRVFTPLDALKAGSDYLVIGRPITQATNPAAVLHSIYQQINYQ